MADTCYVRFPDAKKDNPSEPGAPNGVKEISRHKLDDYRARGFVQCEQDGSAPEKVIPRGGADEDAKPVKLATVKTDPVAAELQADDEGDEGAGAKGGGSAPAGSATGAGGSN